MSKKKAEATDPEVWYETYWWSPPLAEVCGEAFNHWGYGKRHKTMAEAEAHCKAAQEKQPYIWYSIREVRRVKMLEGR